MNVSPIKLNEISRFAEIMAEMCDGDDTLFADMMEAETDAFEVIQRLSDAIAEDQARIAGIKERATDLAERKARYEVRVSAGKRAIGAVLRSAGLPKVELPDATWSVRDGKAKLVVVDPDAVPFDFTRVKPEPDKIAINAAFESADELPNWLTREPATDIVTQRSK
jgi:uncharacterized protein YbjT (DUF2867 family)